MYQKKMKKKKRTHHFTRDQIMGDFQNMRKHASVMRGNLLHYPHSIIYKRPFGHGTWTFPKRVQEKQVAVVFLRWVDIFGIDEFDGEGMVIFLVEYGWNF